MDGVVDWTSETSNDATINNTSQCSSSDDSVAGFQLDEANHENSVNCAREVVTELRSEECEQIATRNLPRINCPEKIVLCVDLTEDPDYTPFKIGEGSKYSPLYMVKRVIQIFMYSKNTMNDQHEFALVVLNMDSAVWLRDFTKNPKEIITYLETCTHTSQNDTFNLTALFDVLKENVKLPQCDLKGADTIIPFSVRVILLYSRSFCVPEFGQGRDSFDYFASSPFFTLDILYIHEHPSEDNKCEEAFNVLDGLDEQGFSYVFEVVRNATKLHDNMAKLLAHPLQRPPQKLAQYKLKEVQDIH